MITRVNSSIFGNSTTGSASMAFTCSGVQRALVLPMRLQSGIGSDVITYNGVALQRAVSQYSQASDGNYSVLWWLLNPPEGSFTLSAIWSVGQYFLGWPACYSGVRGFGSDVAAQVSASQATMSLTVPNGEAGALIVGGMYSHAAGVPTAGAGTTAYQSGGNYGAYESDSPLTIGSNSIIGVGSGADDLAYIAGLLLPALGRQFGDCKNIRVGDGMTRNEWAS